MQLTGKVAIVTGGGRGIGRATALALAEDGADVAVAARSENEIQAVAEEIRSRGRRAVAVVCDVTRYEDCQAMVDQVVGELGRLDILVNNAGVMADRRPFLESDPTGWAQTILVNVVGVYNCCRAAVPSLIAAGGGKIINIGSGAGYRPLTGNSSYNTSKAAVAMLTRILSQELWQYGIDVNEVLPGPVETEMTKDRFKAGQPPDHAPMERVRTPEEPAELVLWLARWPPGGPNGQAFGLGRRPL